MLRQAIRKDSKFLAGYLNQLSTFHLIVAGEKLIEYLRHSIPMQQQRQQREQKDFSNHTANNRLDFTLLQSHNSGLASYD